MYYMLQLPISIDLCESDIHIDVEIVILVGN